jgi:photosystem II stability/assembly factor-like uncharacterized protein
MNQFIKSIGLVAAMSLVISEGASGYVPAEPGDSPGESAGPPDDNDVFKDTELNARAAAVQDRFGDYLSESYKQSLMQTLQTQGALYANLLPGGNPPPNIPLWRSLGPTNAKYETNSVTLKVADSGRVRTILQSPADPDTVYVLTSGGGLWKTLTFSHTNPQWEAKTDALQTTSGGSVTFGGTPNVLYVGLGDPFDGVPTLGGVVAKSLDGGDSWRPFVNLPGAFTVSDIKVDTTGPSDIVLVATDAGIYRSADAGASFTIAAAVPSQRIWSLAKTSAGWLATSSCACNSPQGRMLYSTDRGANWSFIPNAGNVFSNVSRATLGVAAGGDSIVYAFAANPDGIAQRDLFKSIDGGLNWVALGITGKAPTNPNGWQPDMNLMGVQSFYNQMILVDPTDPSRNTIYLGGQLSTAKTVDGGTTWTLLSDWLPGIFSNLPYVHADHHAAASITLNGNRAIVFGTDGGIFVSSDGGASFGFDKNNGIVSFLAQTVVSSSKNPQSLITGMQDDGTRARMGASDFYNQVIGGDGEGVGWSQANNARTLTTVPGAILSSSGLLPNTRGAWFRFRLNPNLALFYTPMATPTSAADPSGLIFLSALANGPIFTQDGGLTWFYLARSGGRLPSNFFVRAAWHVVGIDPTPNNNNIAVGGAGGRLAITRNGGATWTVQPLLSLIPGFTGFISSPAWTTNGTLYVASESPTPGSIRLLKSTDGGASFSRADNGLPDAGVYHVVPDPRDGTGSSAYAATFLGVYLTRDGGSTWSRFGAGLPAVRSAGLWVSEDGSLLRVATYGRGIWEINP